MNKEAPYAVEPYAEEHPFSKTNVYNDNRWCCDCIKTLLAMPSHDDEDEWDEFKCIPCLELAHACWERAFVKLTKYDDYDKDDEPFCAAKIARINKARINALTELLVKNNIEIGADSKSQFQMQPAVQAAAEPEPEPQPQPQPEAEAAEAEAAAHVVEAEPEPKPQASVAEAEAQPEAQPAGDAGDADVDRTEEALEAAYKAAKEYLAKSISEADNEYKDAYDALLQADLEHADARSKFEDTIKNLEKYRGDAIETYRVVLRKKDAAEATFMAALGHKRSLMEEMQRARISSIREENKRSEIEEMERARKKSRME